MIKPKKKASNTNKLSIVVIAILSIICLISTITLAYFTSQDSKNGTIQFGTIEVDVETSSLVSITRTAEKVMPGDELTVDFDIVNKGEEAYYLTLVTVVGSTDVAGFNDLIGLYAGGLSGTKLVSKLTELTASPTKSVGSLAKDAKVENTKTFTISLENTGNEFKNKEATICVNVFAIQKANMASEAAAYDVLMTMIQPTEAVVIGGVNYFYQKTTDTFQVGDGNPETAITDENLKNVTLESEVLGRNVELNSSSMRGVTLDTLVIPGTISKVQGLGFITVDSVVLKEGVTTISGSAFSSCEVGTIKFPSTVTTIENDGLIDSYISNLYLDGDIAIIKGEIFGSGDPEASSLPKIFIKEEVELAPAAGNESEGNLAYCLNHYGYTATGNVVDGYVEYTRV